MFETPRQEVVRAGSGSVYNGFIFRLLCILLFLKTPKQEYILMDEELYISIEVWTPLIPYLLTRPSVDEAIFKHQYSITL